MRQISVSQALEQGISIAPGSGVPVIPTSSTIVCGLEIVGAVESGGLSGPVMTLAGMARDC